MVPAGLCRELTDNHIVALHDREDWVLPPGAAISNADVSFDTLCRAVRNQDNRPA